MNRREMLQRTGLAALALGGFPLGWTHAADTPKRRLLMYTRSQGFEHPVVQRKGAPLSLAERIVTDLGKANGFEALCTKDGRVFINEDLQRYDAFVFQTQGDLIAQESKDGTPPMTLDGKKALLQAIATGKGFVGCHCASDTFHSKGPSDQNQPLEERDPYIAMIGGEFIVHGQQQKAFMRVVDDKFPGATGLKDFELLEEWYALKNFAPDLHVILAQDTKGMNTDGGNWSYNRPRYPATWARMHQKGRVFFTSMGHREDVWESAIFQALLLGGLSWAVGNVDADVAPNMSAATPQANEMPKAPPPQPRKKKS